MKYLSDEQKQEKRKKMKELCKKVANMPEDQRAALAERLPIATCEGHILSFFNNALIMFQGGIACTLVGGFQQWKRQGRIVMKGQHGYIIFFPKFPKNGNGEDEEIENTDDPEIRFYTTTVFDVTQTTEMDCASHYEKEEGK